MFKRSKSSSGSLSPAGTTRAVFFLLLILAVVTAIRVRLLNMPLERDEGEYAYAGQLLLQDVSPYKAAYNVALKLPGTYVAYAVIMAVFGQTAAALHAGVILVSVATAVLVFVMARRIYGDAAGVVAAGTYALLSIVPETFGLAAHATHFVMLSALAGIVLLQNLENRASAARIFSAGLLIGLAVLMKQTGAAFGFFAVGWILWCELSSDQKKWPRLAARLAWLVLGGLLPIILMCFIIVCAGDFHQFWLWTFVYARDHASIIPFARGISTLAGVVITLSKAATGLWGLAGLGLVLLFSEPSLKRGRAFVAGFAFFSCVAVWPGWRGHYFIQLLPAAGLLAAGAFHAMASRLARSNFSLPPMALPVLIFAVAAASLLIQSSDIFFLLGPVQACRVVYGTNPFPEAVEIGRYLASHSAPDARIVVLGSEPQIYFYSHRRSATAYICTYPLMEPQPRAMEMQQEMIREIETARPDYVVYVHVANSWLQYSDSNPLIFRWFGRYQRENLKLVGLVEIASDGPTQYRWFDRPQTDVQTTAESWLAVFKRRVDSEQIPLKAN
jgi:hypothetical protein